MAKANKKSPRKRAGFSTVPDHRNDERDSRGKHRRSRRRQLDCQTPVSLSRIHVSQTESCTRRLKIIYLTYHARRLPKWRELGTETGRLPETVTLFSRESTLVVLSIQRQPPTLRRSLKAISFCARVESKSSTEISGRSFFFEADLGKE